MASFTKLTQDALEMRQVEFRRFRLKHSQFGFGASDVISSAFQVPFRERVSLITVNAYEDQSDQQQE